MLPSITFHPAGDEWDVPSGHALPGLGWGPAGESFVEGLGDGAHGDAGGFGFGGVHDTVGPRGFGGEAHELGFVGEEVEGFVRSDAVAEKGGDFAGRDRARVGQVVGAEGDLLFMAGEAGGNGIAEMGDGVFRFQEAGVGEQLGEVVAGAVDVVEGDAEAPEVALVGTRQNFFAKGFGAGVEGAVVGAEREIRGVVLMEAAAVLAATGKDAAGRDMAPRDTSRFAGLADAAGKDGIAIQAFRFVGFAGIDVGLAGVAGGIDEEGSARFPDQADDLGGIIAGRFRAADGAVGNATGFEKVLKRGANIAGTAEEKDVHASRKCWNGGEEVIRYMPIRSIILGTVMWKMAQPMRRRMKARTVMASEGSSASKGPPTRVARPVSIR